MITNRDYFKDYTTEFKGELIKELRASAKASSCSLIQPNLTIMSMIPRLVKESGLTESTILMLKDKGKMKELFDSQLGVSLLPVEVALFLKWDQQIAKRNIARKELNKHSNSTIHKSIIDKFNNKLSVLILNGYVFKPGYNMGKFFIERRERFRTENLNGKEPRKFVDFYRTNKLKKQLIKEGIPLFNKHTNPTGAQYLVFKTSSHVNWLRWANRSYCPNGGMYSVELPCHNNTGKDLNELAAIVKTKEDVYNMPKIGLLYKMALLERLDSTHYLNYVR